MTEPLPKWLSVQHHTYFNIHSRFQSGRQHLFSKLQLFYLSFKRMTDFFSDAKIPYPFQKSGMQFRTLHVLPLYRIYIIETNTLLFMHLWCKTFYYICYSNRKVRQNVSVILPHSSLFFPIRNHICTLIKIVLRFQ